MITSILRDRTPASHIRILFCVHFVSVRLGPSLGPLPILIGAKYLAPYFLVSVFPLALNLFILWVAPLRERLWYLNVCVWFSLFHVASWSEGAPICYKLLRCTLIAELCKDHRFYPFICEWTQSLPLRFGCCEFCYYNHGCARIFVAQCC